MSNQRTRSPSIYLEPPPKGTELEDPGAQESGSEDDHFSDASEGHRHASGRASPVPRTRVEKVDDEPRYGEVPGTPAYEKRGQDAVPDEIEIIPEGSRSRRLSCVDTPERPLTPSGSPIPRTLVEKVDPCSPSLGEVPGTAVYEIRKADAVPDLILPVPHSRTKSPAIYSVPLEQSPISSVPETLLTCVDSPPTSSMPTGPHAHRRRPSDALPDETETIPDAPGFGDARKDDDAVGSDFDEFEEGAEGTGYDDFGDFDDAFQPPNRGAAENLAMDQSPVASLQPPTVPSFPSLLDMDTIGSLPDLIAAMNDRLDVLFPNAKEISSLPPVDPIPDSSAIFTTERSLSLWSQLVAPPPLQPPNWVKSRIRRLFLVSLGVPVDLDEILPASKQKKLVLPSINLEQSRTTSSELSRSLSKFGKKDGPQNMSSTSVNSIKSPSRQRSGRRRGPPPPPDLDLSAVRRLCSTTDAALDGMTDTELKAHINALEEMTVRASEVLEYWLKRRDGLLSEKEAFEGVIENLVNHARRVRK